MSANKRPVFLNLFRIHFPVTALISIAHRVSGIVLVFALPGWLWVLQETLGSASDYQAMLQTLHVYRIGVWLSLVACSFHMLSGLRHLMMDCGWGESLSSARISAVMVGVFSAALAGVFGVMLWS